MASTRQAPAGAGPQIGQHAGERKRARSAAGEQHEHPRLEHEYGQDQEHHAAPADELRQRRHVPRYLTFAIVAI
jgi:hypothetical protein